MGDPSSSCSSRPPFSPSYVASVPSYFPTPLTHSPQTRSALFPRLAESPRTISPPDIEKYAAAALPTNGLPPVKLPASVSARAPTAPLYACTLCRHTLSADQKRHAIPTRSLP